MVLCSACAVHQTTPPLLLLLPVGALTDAPGMPTGEGVVGMGVPTGATVTVVLAGDAVMSRPIFGSVWLSFMDVGSVDTVTTEGTMLEDGTVLAKTVGKSVGKSVGAGVGNAETAKSQANTVPFVSANTMDGPDNPNEPADGPVQRDETFWHSMVNWGIPVRWSNDTILPELL